MKKRTSLLLVPISLFTVSFLSGCNNKSAFTVTWKNYDGTILEKDNNVRKGTLPTYDSKTPIREDDQQFYYVFSGWTPEVKAIKKDMTYTATYTAHDMTNVDEDPDAYEDKLPDTIHGGNIFHAFCWKYNDVKNKLSDLANAGFKAVQISPVQQPKDGGTQWWAYYQPLSFSIANSSVLGTKSELQQLCAAAATYNIDIVADIIFNHMANIDDNQKESDGTPKVYPGVESFEPYLYQHRNDSSNPTFHHNPGATGSGAETQFYAYGNLPDLNTAHPKVQERCLDLLKECIDVGIDGFRIDTAKHIETPDDPDYPSDFWPNVLNPAKQYYKDLNDNKELFVYGEVLGNPLNRSIDVYTKLMNVNEDSYGTGLRSALNGYAQAGLNKYGKLTSASNLVSWVESHDTYEAENSHIDQEKIMRGFAIAGTRKNTKCLYLSRPDNSSTVGKISDYSFESPILSAINKFHNRFVDGEEYQSANDSVYVNQFVKGNSKGAVIVDLKPNGEIALMLDKLATGVYYDQISGKAYTVREGHLIIDMPSSGVVILTQSKNGISPTIDVDFAGGAFVNDKEINITTNSETSTYSINGGSPVNFSLTQKLSLGSLVDSSNKVKLVVTATNGKSTLTREYNYNKIELVPGYFNVVNVNSSYFSNNEIYMWSWGGSDSGHWSSNFTKYENKTLLVNTSGLEGMLFALFPKNYAISDNYHWDFNAIRQTSDIKGDVLAQGYYDASDF